jgi:glutathione synthase/RimK-type ligase-like ATP-grasp enzyme
MRILPYKFGSKSAKALAAALSTYRVRHDGEFRNNFRHTILNWGSSQAPVFPVYSVINSFEAVSKAANKLTTLQLLAKAEVSCPVFFTDRVKAATAADTDMHTVVARTTLFGHSGQGIVIVEPGEGSRLPYAPLYTLYFKKKREFRVHVFGGNIIDFQEKKKRSNVEPVDWRVRNYDSGFVFCREGVELPEVVAEQSIKAVLALGLDFGAVDVGYNEQLAQACVFEVNTACGLEGSTVRAYAEAVKNWTAQF